ncbi:apolipoprotein R-like [Echinops telfairi]|uniref:Apolipoprotein R-like n=1 Tax=Echinops telfairi TaxID=9371 RepID=A0AC55DQW0_ECHTE|nr:apolipoprotein R-like [Echinops telfairi]
MRAVPLSSPQALLGILALLLCPLGPHGCSLPPRIKHGHHKDVSQLLSFTTEVQYECEEGYILVGEAKISCLFSGWSSPAPQCKALCPKPEIPNGKLFVEKAQYVSPETAIIQCDPGYRVVGSPTISCSDNKSWSPKVPKCEKDPSSGVQSPKEPEPLETTPSSHPAPGCLLRKPALHPSARPHPSGDRSPARPPAALIQPESNLSGRCSRGQLLLPTDSLIAAEARSPGQSPRPRAP